MFLTTPRIPFDQSPLDVLWNHRLAAAPETDTGDSRKGEKNANDRKPNPIEGTCELLTIAQC